MRKEAQDYRNQLLSEIKASVGTRGQAAAASTSASSSGEQGAIKKKLENAIVIMQEGLVERQAEVGCSLREVEECGGPRLLKVRSLISPVTFQRF